MKNSVVVYQLLTSASVFSVTEFSCHSSLFSFVLKYLQEVTKLLFVLELTIAIFNAFIGIRRGQKFVKMNKALGKRIVGEKTNCSIKILGQNKCFLQVLSDCSIFV